MGKLVSGITDFAWGLCVVCACGMVCFLRVCLVSLSLSLMSQEERKAKEAVSTDDDDDDDDDKDDKKKDDAKKEL